MKKPKIKRICYIELRLYKFDEPPESYVTYHINAIFMADENRMKISLDTDIIITKELFYKIDYDYYTMDLIDKDVMTT